MEQVREGVKGEGNFKEQGLNFKMYNIIDLCKFFKLNMRMVESAFVRF